jgi:hypothetical protein
VAPISWTVEVCRYTHARQFVTRAAAGVEPPLRSSPVVLFSLAYAVVRLVLEALIVHGRANAGLRAEVLALRHQLRVLERQAGRPRWQIPSCRATRVTTPKLSPPSAIASRTILTARSRSSGGYRR